MTAQFRSIPKFEQPLTEGKDTTSWWYRYWQAHETGQPPSGELTIKVGTSPFIYAAPRQGSVVVSGGTVSAIAIERTGTFYTTGLTAGMFQLSQFDELKVTYSGKPNMVFFPS